MVMLVVQTMCSLFVLGALLVSLYYWFWVIVAAVSERLQTVGDLPCDYKFAICVPAHNESSVIRKSLKHLVEIDYPSDKFDIYVIADNCSDNTAAIVREAGVRCLERFDEKNKGKGFALEWGIKQIFATEKEYHAIVVVDADCYLDLHSLKVFGWYFHAGEKVLQANFQIINCDENPMTFIAALGTFIENSLYYSSKSKVGVSCFLQGTGMAISRNVLLTYPWSSFSSSEDFEYSLCLMRGEIKVTFVDDVHVYTMAPSTNRQLHIQRSRWASGAIGLGKIHGLSLILEGVRSRNINLIDAGIHSITFSRPLIFLYAVIALILSSFLWAVSPGWLSTGFIAISMLALSLQVGYYLVGLFKMGLSLKRVKLCIKALGVGWKLISITCHEWVAKSDGSWNKTPR